MVIRVVPGAVSVQFPSAGSRSRRGRGAADGGAADGDARPGRGRGELLTGAKLREMMIIRNYEGRKRPRAGAGEGKSTGRGRG